MAETKWVRPLLNLEEVLYEVALKQTGYAVLTYYLEIQSKEPVTETQFKEAITHLHRKCPNLRAIVKERDGQLWLAEMEEEVIDFEMKKGVTPVEVRNQLKEHKFAVTPESPFYKVIILQQDEMCPIYKVFLHVNHLMIDGTSTIKVYNGLMDILENVISKKEIDDSIQLGSMIYGEELTFAVQKEINFFEENPEIKETYFKEYETLATVDPILDKFYKKFDGDGDFESLHEEFSIEETALLVSKCKEGGVTVNTAITAIVNIALIKEFQRLGINQDDYLITGIHWVNFRRHMEHGNEALGCFIGNSVFRQRISVNVMDHFWKYVKTLQTDLRENLVGQDMIRQEAARQILGQALDVNAVNTPFYGYHLSNYTKVDIPLRKNGKIRPLSFRRESSTGGGAVALCIVFYTFNGRLFLSIDYCKGFLGRDRVESIMENILTNFKKYILF